MSRPLNCSMCAYATPSEPRSASAYDVYPAEYSWREILGGLLEAEREAVAQAGMLQPHHRIATRSNVLVSAAGDPHLPEHLAGQCDAQAGAPALRFLADLSAQLDGFRAVDAVAKQSGSEGLAVVRALDAEVLAHRAQLRAPVAQPRVQQLGAGEEVLHDHGLASENVAYDEPRLACPREQREVVDDKRTRWHLGRLPKHVVHVQVHRARCGRLARQNGQRVGDETR